MSRKLLLKARSALCLLTAALLLAATPGLECYAAVEHVFDAGHGGMQAARFVPGAHASTTWIGRMAGTVINSTLPGARPGRPAAPASREAEAPALNAASAEPAAELEKKEGVSLSAGARQDFMRRVSPHYKESDSSSDDIVPVYQDASVSGVSLAGLESSKSKKGTKKPEVERPPRGFDDAPAKDPEDDGLSRPVRGHIDGPDSAPDAGGSGRSGVLFGGGLFGLSAISAAFGGKASGPVFIGALLLSMLRHEMAHAREAYKHGDAQSVAEGRLKWWTLKGLWSHVDPTLTILLPILSYRMLGMPLATLKPVEARDELLGASKAEQAIAKAKVAWAGPRENLLLALGGAFACAGLAHLGLGGAAAGAALLFTKLNVMLGVTNLLPFYPLDGRFILRGVLYKAGLGALAEKIEKLYHTEDHWYDRISSTRVPAKIAEILIAIIPKWGVDPGQGALEVKVADLLAKIAAVYVAATPFLAFMAAASYFHLFPWAILKASSLLVGGAAAMLGGGTAGGAHLASASFPGLASLGMMFGWGKPEPEAEPAEPDNAVDFIVVLKGAPKVLAQDMHIAAVDAEGLNFRGRYEQAQDKMYKLIADATAGKLSREVLAAYGASPVATYKRINAVTLRLGASQAGKLKERAEALGYQVHENERRAAASPTGAPPAAVPASGIRALAGQWWGAPGAFGRAALFVLGLVGAAPAQPPVAVIGTGISAQAPALRGIREPRNATVSEGQDDQGSGTKVTAAVRASDPWLDRLTHYKAFAGGAATTDDLLRAKTMAANDGHILILDQSSRSSEGGPQGPEALMDRALALEGRVVVSAADEAAGRRAGDVALLCMLFGVKGAGPKLDKIVKAYEAALQDAEAAYRSLAAELKPAKPGFLGRLVLDVMGREGRAS